MPGQDQLPVARGHNQHHRAAVVESLSLKNGGAGGTPADGL